VKPCLWWSRPHRCPAIINAEKADENPELAVLSAITHGRDKDIKQAIVIARTAIESALRLPDQHEGLRRAKPEGKAEGDEAIGEAKGEAKGVAESLIEVLQLRGLSPTPVEREQIHATKDVAQLRRWLASAMTATTVADALKS